MKWMIATLFLALLTGCGGSSGDSSGDNRDNKEEVPTQIDGETGNETPPADDNSNDPDDPDKTPGNQGGDDNTDDGNTDDDANGGEDPDGNTDNNTDNNTGNAQPDPLFNDVSQAQEVLLQQSLQQGMVAEGLGLDTLLQVALNQLALDQHRYDSAQQQLLTTGLSWQLPADAVRLQTRFGRSAPALLTDAGAEGESEQAVFAAISGDDGQRQLVMGVNPMIASDDNINAAVNKWQRSSLAWLAQRDVADASPLTIALAHLPQTEEQAMREWLLTYFPESEFSALGACDGVNLLGCLTTEVDVLILGQQGQPEQREGLMLALDAVQQQGIGVLYWQRGAPNDIGRAVLEALQVDYLGNNGAGYVLDDLNMAPYIGKLPAPEADMQRTVKTLLDGDSQFDFSLCEDGDCRNVAGFYAQFWQGAQALQQQLRELDADNTALFDGQVSGWLPWLVLAGDAARQQVRYPMDRLNTPTPEFLRAMFADVSVYYSRSSAPAAPDLGNFSRTDFSHITPVNQSIETRSRPPFRSTGVYVLPGQTVTVRRYDGSAADVTVFINSVRDSATRWWQGRNEYNRPKYLRSVAVRLPAGETVQLTSPYGGPLQLGFSDNNSPVRVLVENVGLHPYWNGTDDSTAFFGDLAADDYDWAELATPYFEIHAKRDKLQASVEDWAVTPQALATDTQRYLDQLPHMLAGFQGEGIDEVLEISNFALQYDLDLTPRQHVQHMNADQASCGWGCPGNPYDTDGRPSPTGHGDLHQLGRNLTRPLFRFDGWGEYSATNLYSYFSKYRHYVETDKTPQCHALPFRQWFDAIVVAQQSDDAMASIQQHDYRRWTHGAAVYLQLMMAAQMQGALQDGWMLLPRLHLLERRFSEAMASNSSWLAQREALGFTSIPWSLAQDMGANDWLVVAMSQALARDVRPFLAMYGIKASDMIQPRVDALTLPPLERQFYVADAQSYCLGLEHTSLAVDGSDVWPGEEVPDGDTGSDNETVDGEADSGAGSEAGDSAGDVTDDNSANEEGSAAEGNTEGESDTTAEDDTSVGAT